MSQLKSKLPTDIWVVATWDEYIQGNREQTIKLNVPHLNENYYGNLAGCIASYFSAVRTKLEQRE